MNSDNFFDWKMFISTANYVIIRLNKKQQEIKFEKITRHICLAIFQTTSFVLAQKLNKDGIKMTFKELKLIDPILKAVSREGYKQPSPIQAKAIPILLEGRDLLGC
ncbi:MAG: DEAD/DEAH box helicase, partial [Oscillospiraceae bacterium]|nr:DEAD/DEAH box helicase [Oscillospiraceae bacterium]